MSLIDTQTRNICFNTIDTFKGVKDTGKIKTDTKGKCYSGSS